MPRWNWEPARQPKGPGSETLHLKRGRPAGEVEPGSEGRADARVGLPGNMGDPEASMATSHGTEGEGNGVGGKGQGSLSALIVAVESRETEPAGSR